MALLIEKGAQINAVKAPRGRLPIHHAAFNGAAEAVELLIKHGADFNDPVRDSWTIKDCTPLSLAVKWGSPAAALCLMKHKAKLPQRHKMLAVDYFGRFNPLKTRNITIDDEIFNYMLTKDWDMFNDDADIDELITDHLHYDESDSENNPVPFDTAFALMASKLIGDYGLDVAIGVSNCISPENDIWQWSDLTELHFAAMYNSISVWDAVIARFIPQQENPFNPEQEISSTNRPNTLAQFVNAKMRYVENSEDGAILKDQLTPLEFAIVLNHAEMVCYIVKFCIQNKIDLTPMRDTLAQLLASDPENYQDLKALLDDIPQAQMAPSQADTSDDEDTIEMDLDTATEEEVSSEEDDSADEDYEPPRKRRRFN